MGNPDSTLIDRAKRGKKNLAKITEAAEQARLQVMACELALEEARQEQWASRDALLNDLETAPFRPYESVPDDDIGDIIQWTVQFRRRVWGTAFSGGFAGKTGTRDMMLLLSLAHLMETMGTRVFCPSLTDIVRVSAMDKNTVVAGLQSLRTSDLLLRTAAQSYALADHPLVSLDVSPDVPKPPLAARFFLGDRAGDAFGGQFGVKVTEIRAWMWMLLHPGVTRYALAKGAGIGVDTARRVVDTLIAAPHRLAILDENDGCHARGADRDPKAWLDHYTDARDLYGKMTERMERTEATAYFRAETRVTARKDLEFDGFEATQ